MIRVAPRPEPPSFDAQVRQPGNRWLAAHPAARTKSMPPHWRLQLPELREAYKGICAYYCCHVSPVTGGGTVDHFVPKSADRALAYEWANYRFACARMNGRKGVADTVPDPFTLTDGMFQIRFSTMRVVAAPGLSATDARVVGGAVRRLRLNSRECCTERAQYWKWYLEGQVQASILVEWAPFLALEAARQDLLRAEDRARFTQATIRAWLDG